MLRSSGLVVLILLGCSGPTTPPTPPGPPQVFLIAPETNVIGDRVNLTVNVSGCTRVEQLQIFQSGVVLKTAVFKGANTKVEITAGDLATFYNTLGIAADLTLSAKAICDDGRNNKSPPVGVKFFPVASVLEPTASQAIIMPDSFVAEGGTAGKPVTFIGCANTGAGLSLVRVDLEGNVISVNSTLPFGCDYYATISDKIAGDLRWLYQPGSGAFAFNSSGIPGQDLNITGGVLGDSYAIFAVGPDGDALVWDNAASTAPAVTKIRRDNGTANGIGNNMRWFSMVSGIVNGQPVFDNSTGLAFIPTWRAALGSRTGNQTIQTVNWATGGNPTGEIVLVSQTYAFLDAQDPPNVAFSPNGRTLYIPFQAAGGAEQSGVMACGTQGSGAGCTPRWRSPLVPGIIQYVIPFASGTRIAAISSNKVWFIDDNDTGGGGTIVNPDGIPTAVSGQLVISGAQAGAGTDFYLLAGTPFATELIAFDKAENGEVWRYSFEGGNTPQNAITMAIDEGGAAWLRLGVKQVKPLSPAEYRATRGPTIPTP